VVFKAWQSCHKLSGRQALVCVYILKGAEPTQTASNQLLAVSVRVSPTLQNPAYTLIKINCQKSSFNTEHIVVQNFEVRLTCGKYNAVLKSACENSARADGLYNYL
jgi:hypothetical protein